jgi:hypothetical protein
MISYDGLGRRGLVTRFAAGRFRPGRVNAIGVAEHRGVEPHQLLALLHQRLEPRGLTAGFGGRIG